MSDRIRPLKGPEALTRVAPSLTALAAYRISMVLEAGYLRRRLEQPVERGLAQEMKLRLRELDEDITRRFDREEAFAAASLLDVDFHGWVLDVQHATEELRAQLRDLGVDPIT